MKDTHLTIRLPELLHEELIARAERDATPKSHLVREAVTQYLGGAVAEPVSTRLVTAADLAARWPALPHLSPDEASELARDIAEACDQLPPATPAWECSSTPRF